jgi:hypothetical protein
MYPVVRELVCKHEVQESAEGRSLGEAIGDGTRGRVEVVDDERGAAVAEETSDESHGLLGCAL